MVGGKSVNLWFELLNVDSEWFMVVQLFELSFVCNIMIVRPRVLFILSLKKRLLNYSQFVKHHRVKSELFSSLFSENTALNPLLNIPSIFTLGIKYSPISFGHVCDLR